MTSSLVTSNICLSPNIRDINTYYVLDDAQLREVNVRLACYRIRFYKGAYRNGRRFIFLKKQQHGWHGMTCGCLESQGRSGGKPREGRADEARGAREDGPREAREHGGGEDAEEEPVEAQQRHGVGGRPAPQRRAEEARHAAHGHAHHGEEPRQQRQARRVRRPHDRAHHQRHAQAEQAPAPRDRLALPHYCLLRGQTRVGESEDLLLSRRGFFFLVFAGGFPRARRALVVRLGRCVLAVVAAMSGRRRPVPHGFPFALVQSHALLLESLQLWSRKIKEQGKSRMTRNSHIRGCNNQLHTCGTSKSVYCLNCVCRYGGGIDYLALEEINSGERVLVLLLHLVKNLLHGLVLLERRLEPLLQLLILPDQPVHLALHLTKKPTHLKHSETIITRSLLTSTVQSRYQCEQSLQEG